MEPKGTQCGDKVKAKAGMHNWYLYR